MSYRVLVSTTNLESVPAQQPLFVVRPDTWARQTQDPLSWTSFGEKHPMGIFRPLGPPVVVSWLLR